jgi:hypothetical protein
LVSLFIPFPRTHNYFESLIGSSAFNQLNEEERNGLVFIHDKKEVTKSQYAIHFGFNDKKAQRHLQRFSGLKLVKLTGKGPASKYVFTK